jgi:microcystin-dependent protein
MFRGNIMNKISTILLGAIIVTSSLVYSSTAFADEPYLGEMAYFAGNFAPRGWAKCDGQILPINSNESLFSLLGTTYGGDGRTTFALPDMRGRALIHAGRGAGLTDRRHGQKLGSETVTMSLSNMPSHNHTLKGTSSNADNDIAEGKSLAAAKIYKTGATADQTLHSATISNTGNGQSINTVQPTLALTCIIAIQGLFPSRN